MLLPMLLSAVCLLIEAFFRVPRLRSLVRIVRTSVIWLRRVIVAPSSWKTF